MNPGTVKDSSIWLPQSDHRAITEKDPYLRIGIVQHVYVDENNKDIRYLVQVQDKNDKITATCRYIRRFGGVYNYEDIIYRGYSTDDKPDPTLSLSTKPGDIVIVVFFNGQGREGLILGGITHAARDVSLDVNKGPQYLSEFNGVETSINSDGEYRLTFKGQPTNLQQLNSTPTKEVPPPTYNTDTGSSFLLFDKSGGFTVTDNANSNPQILKIDKSNGTINLISGQVSHILDKNANSITQKSDLLKIDAITSINTNTQNYLLNASTATQIKSPKVAIGTEDVELLQQLLDAIDKLGAVQPISPVGLCTPLNATPQWSAVVAVKNKIQQIKGSF